MAFDAVMPIDVTFSDADTPSIRYLIFIFSLASPKAFAAGDA